MAGRKVGRSFYISEEVDFEITIDEVIEFVSDYATVDEIKQIQSEINSMSTSNISSTYNTTVSTLEDEMKMELLMLAFKKYNLVELEAKLGTKFDY